MTLSPSRHRLNSERFWDSPETIQAITDWDAFGPPIWVVLKATLSLPTPGSSYLSGLGARDPHCISLPWCLFENFPSLVLLYPLLAMWLSENLKSQHSNHTHVNLHNVWFQKLALSQTRINSLNHLSHKITSQQALKKNECSGRRGPHSTLWNGTSKPCNKHLEMLHDILLHEELSSQLRRENPRCQRSRQN